MEIDAFIDALYNAGWDSPCDAQHDNIKGVYEQVRLGGAETAYQLGIKAGLRQAADISAASNPTKDILASCRMIFATGDLVGAVKLYRAHTNCGLKEAVDAIKGIG